eukprot:CAMPEP_0118876322 /NCGR_PEP_ID=MMETSP1163-20130328/17067_1 /TAXON_ID=124430 /ORGANISM="Phaeomonas parva, Strain CCMP2877" /LENGTH=131 /DNA_ID=CAMNT_0006811927 /DNA_START=264 /DNA_END=656 /DNA_ORIENTATION=+
MGAAAGQAARGGGVRVGGAPVARSVSGEGHAPGVVRGVREATLARRVLTGGHAWGVGRGVRIGGAPIARRVSAGGDAPGVVRGVRGATLARRVLAGGPAWGVGRGVRGGGTIEQARTARHEALDEAAGVRV